MNIDRRALIAGSALLLAEANAPDAQAIAVVVTPATETLKTSAAYIDFAAYKGLNQLTPFSLINGIAATGGYTYDETAFRSDFAPSSFVLQNCARVSDISDRGRFGVLPLFTIAASRHAQINDVIPFVFPFLIERQGLRPQSMTFTTLAGNPLLPFLSTAGISASQLRFRDTTAAQAAGDGSGWFRDPVTGKGYPSMSIEYSRDSRRIEIAEIVILGNDGGVMIGCGLERIAWARTGLMSTWSELLPNLLAHTRAFCSATSAQLPAGYSNFLATSAS